MDNPENKKRFRTLLENIDRPGMTEFLTFLEGSDFFEAPASTRFHLSCIGGLCQHSLNVYDALCWLSREIDSETGKFVFSCAGGQVVSAAPQTVTIVSLLHDVCKIKYYALEWKNKKVYKEDGSKRDSGGNYDWERVPGYTVEDKSPYGHGEKSVMMITEYMKLTSEEKYAIRWHMGYAMEPQANVTSISAAIEKHPLVWFLHSADMMATRFMEGQQDNKLQYQAHRETAKEGT